MPSPASLFGPHAVLPAHPRRHASDEIAIDLPTQAEMRTTIAPAARRTFMVAAILTLCILIVRVGELQVRQGALWRAYAEDNRLRIETVPASRGLVTDRNGLPLAENITLLALQAEVRHAPKERAARIEALATLTLDGIVVDETTAAAFIENTISSPLLLFEDELTTEAAVRLKARQDLFPWLHVVTHERRQVHGGDVFAHVIGYLGKIDSQEWEYLKGAPARYQGDDLVGKSGIEKLYELMLRGVPGRRQIEVDARGRGDAVVIEEPAHHGERVQLTLDAQLQKIAVSALAEAVKATGGSGGALVVLDPHTGGVLALASTPAFQVDRFARGEPEYVARILNDAHRPLFNRAVSGQYPIGSTIKPMIAAAGLQEGVVKPQTQIHSTGGLRVGAWFFPDWKAGGHGWVDVYQAVAESVNTYFYVVGGGFEERVGLGIEKMVRYARAFGLGASTGIDLPGERPGFVPTPEWKEQAKGEQWYVGDTYHFAIGQGDVLATPLQVARMTAVFANGGFLVTPHVVQGVRGDESAKVEEMDANTIEVVKAAMRQTVTDGSARALGGLPIAVAGKTGTAQVGGNNPPHAWFIGFAPYKDPEIVVTVLIEHGGEGSVAAVPVARQVFGWWALNGNADGNGS